MPWSKDAINYETVKHFFTDHVEEDSLTKGVSVIKEGQSKSYFFIIKEGECKLTKKTEHDDTLTGKIIVRDEEYMTLSEGSCMEEDFTIFDRDATYTATVKTAILKVYKISK